MKILLLFLLLIASLDSIQAFQPQFKKNLTDEESLLVKKARDGDLKDIIALAKFYLFVAADFTKAAEHFKIAYDKGHNDSGMSYLRTVLNNLYLFSKEEIDRLSPIIESIEKKGIEKTPEDECFLGFWSIYNNKINQAKSYFQNALEKDQSGLLIKFFIGSFYFNNRYILLSDLDYGINLLNEIYDKDIRSLKLENHFFVNKAIFILAQYHLEKNDMSEFDKCQKMLQKNYDLPFDDTNISFLKERLEALVAMKPDAQQFNLKLAYQKISLLKKFNPNGRFYLIDLWGIWKQDNTIFNFSQQAKESFIESLETINDPSLLFDLAYAYQNEVYGLLQDKTKAHEIYKRIVTNFPSSRAAASIYSTDIYQPTSLENLKKAQDILSIFSNYNHEAKEDLEAIVKRIKTVEDRKRKKDKQKAKKKAEASLEKNLELPQQEPQPLSETREKEATEALPQVRSEKKSKGKGKATTQDISRKSLEPGSASSSSAAADASSDFPEVNFEGDDQAIGFLKDTDHVSGPAGKVEIQKTREFYLGLMEDFSDRYLADDDKKHLIFKIDDKVSTLTIEDTFYDQTIELFLSETLDKPIKNIRFKNINYHERVQKWFLKTKKDIQSKDTDKDKTLRNHSFSKIIDYLVQAYGDDDISENPYEKKFRMIGFITPSKPGSQRRKVLFEYTFAKDFNRNNHYLYHRLARPQYG